VNYLLDTHVFLWVLSAPKRLSSVAMAAIQNPDYSIFISAVSGMEIAIKKRLGKLEALEGLLLEIPQRGLTELPLKYAHTEMLLTLPDHHQDPFDRILVAQALHEKLTLVTHDQKLAPYGAKILWT